MQNSFKAGQNRIYAYLLFFIWPFLSIFVAFYEYRTSWAKNLIWFFVAFYAYTMVISHAGMDANRYRAQFIEVAQSDEKFDSENGLYSVATNNVDFLQPLLNIIVAKITDNYKVLFLVYGLIFGYFFSRNIWLLLENTPRNRIIKIGIPILIVFAFINPFWNINGFRFWTAAQIFVYGCLVYFLKGKKKGLLIILTTVLVHFSFMLPIAILFLYKFLGNRLNIYFYFFIASLFVSELSLDAVRSNLAFLPTIYENRVEAYTDAEYKELRLENSQSSNWYVNLHAVALRFSVYVFLIALYWKTRVYIKKNKKIYSLFNFILLFFGIANIISSVPSAGRFTIVASCIAMAFVYLSVQFLNDRIINLIIKISIPALLLFFIVAVRVGFYTIGLTTIFGNPLIAVFMENDKALIELIK